MNTQEIEKKLGSESYKLGNYLMDAIENYSSENPNCDFMNIILSLYNLGVSLIHQNPRLDYQDKIKFLLDINKASLEKLQQTQN